MKVQKEEIIFEEGLSYRVSFPSFKNYFFWHYHPEIEIEYIEAPNGIKHVGKHMSSFTNGDLILIGSNVPHVNFDHGIKEKCFQVVIQLRCSFIDEILNIPEFFKIKEMLERAYLGFSFGNETKRRIAEKLKENISLLDLIEILQIMAECEEIEELNTADTRVHFFLEDNIRLVNIYKYVYKNYHTKLNITELSQIVHLCPTAFCKYFKKNANMKFMTFVNRYRISQAKTLLLQNRTVAEVCYEVGFDSISYFSSLFKRVTGVSPTTYKKIFSSEK